jgi:hypothetical protein
MEKRKLLVLGIALVLMAVVVGSVFAASSGGVSIEWATQNGQTVLFFRNSNSYSVDVEYSINGKEPHRLQVGQGSGYFAYNGNYPNGSISIISVGRY